MILLHVTGSFFTGDLYFYVTKTSGILFVNAWGSKLGFNSVVFVILLHVTGSFFTGKFNLLHPSPPLIGGEGGSLELFLSSFTATVNRNKLQ